MKTSTLIIDGYGFAFRAYHTQPQLTYNNTPIGCIYGFTSMLLKLINDFKPLRAVVVFDHGGKNFRHDIYPEYKQNRPPIPQDLKSQLPLLREAALALNFKTMEEFSLEADDIIASLAAHANFNGDRALIVSSDKDLMQLVNEKIWMFDPVKQEYIKDEEVFKKFAVKPSNIIDFLAIVGDAADNVPGIKGLGPKAASELINMYGNLQNIYNNIQDIPQKRRKELLEQGRSNAFLSLELVKLKNDLEISWSNLTWSKPEGEQIFAFLQKYGLRSLFSRAERLFELKQAHNYSHQQESLVIDCLNLDNPDHMQDKIYQHGIVALLWHDEKLLISCEKSKIYTLKADQDFIKSIIQDSSIIKVTYDLKSLMHKPQFKGWVFSSCHDIMLMYYAISAGNKQLSLPDIISTILEVHVGNSSFNGNSCALLISLYHTLLRNLQSNAALYLYHEIDLPLCYVLFDMEVTGIAIDPNRLKQLSREFAQRASDLEQQIFSLSGKTFNLASAKQLGEILFEHLKLPGGKQSSKSQNYITNNEVLESLQDQGFQIAKLIINWRHLIKLKNTYLDALPTQINQLSGRLHTHFSQVTTTTSRLSSIEPNLQNIPIRTLDGLSVRSAFVAPEGWMLISADYSQIELRILAEIAQIESMKQAFKKGSDIHADTASQVFDVPLDQVDDDLRRKAKAINFGIIYGISPFGLAQNLGLEQSSAAQYIKDYMLKYPEIEKYFQSAKDFAYKHGFVQNLFARKCFITGINDKNFFARSMAQRAAINAPIQSSAADITKIAMIKLFGQIIAHDLKTKIVLQIHDEILLMSPIHELESIKPLIKDAMINAYQTQIPLVVEIKVGKNWADMIKYVK
jgi:DNA polymerase-1